jgi:type II secretory pathway pseudopilin PulG
MTHPKHLIRATQPHDSCHQAKRKPFANARTRQDSLRLAFWGSRGTTERPSRAGYSLLEMLVYIAVLAVGINLFVSALSTGSRLAATTTLQLGRIEGIRDVQDSFTGYVRRAAAVVPRASSFETGEDLVVLRMPPDQPEGFDYLVLGAVRGPERFTVLGLTEKDGAWSEVYGKTLRQPLGQQQYAVDDSGIRPLITVTLQVAQEDGERKRPFLVHRCSAAPRGAQGDAS